VDSALRLDLRQAVSLLGSRDRELIALRYGADLTARQIGDVLDVKTNAVEVALHRALQTLREALENSEQPVDERTLRAAE
jgi:RNA polymerase sigma factor (sigma-70 family)